MGKSILKPKAAKKKVQDPSQWPGEGMPDAPLGQGMAEHTDTIATIKNVVRAKYKRKLL